MCIRDSLYTVTAILNVIRCRTGSQCRLCRTGVICSYLVALVTRWAAAFWITWSLAADQWHRPTDCCSSPFGCWWKRAQVLLSPPMTETAWSISVDAAGKSRTGWVQQHISHGELTVKQNAKVVNNTWELYCGIRQSQHVCHDFTELVTCSQPDGLHLDLIQLQTVAGHPVTDPCDAFAEVSHRVRVIRGWRADVDLRIIGLVSHWPCNTDPPAGSVA